MDSSSSYDYTYSSSSVSSGDAFALGAGMLVGILILTLVFYAVFAFLLGKIFKKAGEESWKAWVPIYNNWIFMELGGQKGWFALLSLIPFVNLVAVVFQCIAAYHIGLKLQKEGIFVLWYIFLPVVWIIWLAFDSSTWQGAGTTAMSQQMPMGGEAPSFQPPVASTAPPTYDAPQVPAQDNNPMPPSTPPQNPMQ